jgi:hypothetical protein
MTNITLIWLPKNVQFVGFHRMRQLAFEAVRMADLTNFTKPPMINNQLKKAEETTITEWAEQYNHRPHASLVCRMALTSPPDGKTHHMFQLKKYPHLPTMGNTTTSPNTEGPKATFSRLTHSTFYHVITGHAFTQEGSSPYILQNKSHVNVVKLYKQLSMLSCTANSSTMHATDI